MTDAPWASRLQDMADLTTPMTIRVAATLRIADHIAGGTVTLDALAEVTGSHGPTLRRVMRHLVAVGVFLEPATDTYELGDTGKELCTRGPGDARSWLDLQSAIGRVDLALVDLLQSVRTGLPVGREGDTWEALDEDAELSESFDDQMAAGAAAKAPGLAEGFDWSTVEHVVDVGGGNGTLLAALLTAHPHLKGTVVDRPGPARAAERRFAAAGIEDRARTAAQSFFEPLPTGGDVYLLSGILHDWDDERAGRILARCAEAAGTTGRVLVLESLVDPADARSSTTDMDLLMLVTTGGRARPLEDLEELAGAAGLAVRSLTPVASPHSLVEFTAAS
ncbi:methyltransferase [Streptomyces roseoverticillatus]|uniref:methyltransferase n=1 Tax=Streptomyces roseoverticillatus TaxID=66429 RepID=UPI0033ED64FE